MTETTLKRISCDAEQNQAFAHADNVTAASPVDVLVHVRRENLREMKGTRQRALDDVAIVDTTIAEVLAPGATDKKFEIRERIKEEFPRWKFDRDPILAMAKFAFGAGDGNAERYAQKQATLIQYFRSKNLTQTEVVDLLKNHRMDDLLDLARQSNPRRQRSHSKPKIIPKWSARLLEAMASAAADASIDWHCKILMREGVTVTCEVDIAGASE